MSFEVYGNTSSESSNKSKVDFDALNEYVVETADLQERSVLGGIVSAIIDLGLQEQEDAAVVFTGSAEDEEKEIAARPDTYFEDGDNPGPSKKGKVRLKRWPQKPVQSIAIAVDFPDIMLQKGQFFGDEDAEPKPLRMYLGNQFYMKEKGIMVVGRPTPLKVTKNTAGKWSFNKKHLCYKMAAAAKLVDASKDEVFLPSDIDKLLGQAFNFEAQIFFQEKGDKRYYKEYLNFANALTRGQKPPEGEVKTSLIQFNKENDIEDLKELRNHVKNTMKLSSNFPGSKIEEQLKKLEQSRAGSQESENQDTDNDDTQDTPVQEEKKAAPKKIAKKVEKKPEFDDTDDDIPF